jgi:hypothetical protein
MSRSRHRPGVFDHREPGRILGIDVSPTLLALADEVIE